MEICGDSRERGLYKRSILLDNRASNQLSLWWMSFQGTAGDSLVGTHDRFPVRPFDEDRALRILKRI